MRAYFFEVDDDEGYGIAIIAKNTKEARKIAQGYNEYYEYIEMCGHIKRIKYADVSGLKEGIADEQISSVEAVRRGLYQYAISKCPKCGIETEVYLQDDNSISCNQCME